MAKVLVGILAVLVFAGMVLLLYFGLDVGTESIAERPQVQQQPATSGVEMDKAMTVPSIPPSEVKRWLDEGHKFAFIDVREPAEFEKWRIPQAVLVPIEPRATFAERLRRHVPDVNTEIVTFCRAGVRSEDAVRILAKQGYTHAYNMGGIIDWDYTTEGHDY